MMKKTYKSSLLALSVLASFTSCSESESLQQANLSKDKITFHATLDNSWKPLSPASSSRAAIAAATEKGPIVVPTPFGKPLYLHSVVQETADLQQAAAITRGAMQDGTTLNNTYYNDSFGVTAISTNNGTNTALFINQKASKNNEDIWEIDDKTNSRWPFDALVFFHAYAPFNDATDGMWSVTTDAEKVKTKIKYTAKSGETEIPAQPDIIVATNAESRSVSSDDKAVDLKFSHALTAVNFAISKDLTEIFKTEATDGSKLKSIKLSGIPNEGTCELTAKEGAPQTPSQTWTFDTEADGKKKTGTYTFDLTKEDIQVGESYALTSNKDKNILMMIPQKLNGTKAQLTFVLDIKGKGDQTFTFDLSNQTWLPGTSVTYKLSASAINHLENAEVVFPASWKDTETVKYSYPKTDFAAGESIGLYVVNSNNKIEEANLKLTRDQDGKWMPENNDTKFLKLKNYKYFAYYPYNATAPTVDETKDKADEFFKDKIANWHPVKDQNAEDVLLSQDLQVGEGVIDNDASTLTFNMAHSMGLAVLNLENKEIPKTRRFKNNNYTYYYPDLPGRVTTEPTKGTDYTDDNTKQTVRASNAFLDNIPCASKITTAVRYLQIVKPSTDVSFRASDESGNPRSAWGTHTSYTFNVAQNAAELKSIKTDADFYQLARKYDCTQNVETFTALEGGTYTLECWGAQGADFDNHITPKLYGGKGGYARGMYTMNKEQNIFICVGGHLNGYNNKIPNVVNPNPGPAGGGATSITTTNRGELSNFNLFRGEVLLVAGGGGAQDAGEGTPKAGVGGGLYGGDGQGVVRGYGARPDGPGANGLRNTSNLPHNHSAGFGYGGVASVWDPNGGGWYDFGAQGGSGYYGGGGTQQAGPAGGGSSYYGGVTSGTTIDGNGYQPSPNGDTTQIGQSDSGHCVISWFLK